MWHRQSCAVMRATLALSAIIVGSSASTSASAGSVTQPGFSTGIPNYAKLPEGLFLVLIPNISERSTNPDTVVKFFTPFFVYQPDLEIAKARITFLAAPVYLDVRVRNGAFHRSGLFNTYVGTQATWDLGNNWGAGVRLGGWIGQKGAIALTYGTIEPRAGVTYFTPKEHFSLNVLRGYTLRANGPRSPNYLNVDLTYTRTFGKLEIGALGYGSLDTERPVSTYRLQSQVGIGPLIGYNFGKFNVQLKLTGDVYQKNYGGSERRAQAFISIPLWIAKTPPPAGTVRCPLSADCTK